MPFETRNIQNTSSSKKIFRHVKDTHALEENERLGIYTQYKKYIWGAVVLCFLGLVYGGFAYFQTHKKEVLNDTLEVATHVLGEDLQKSDDNITNILLLGSGGENHEGGYLTDSIIVMSLNHTLSTVSMLSIPRDLYVRYSVEGKKRKGKINRVFMDSMNYWKFSGGKTDVKEMIALSTPVIEREVSKIIGEEIDYSLYIDFQGFVKIVDQLGGVEINVDKKIYDSLYPGPNFSYTIFKLDEGLQTLNGATALKYVRSRHGNAGGDFGRSYRQKKAIFALKEKALASGVLTSPSQLKSILGIIDENFWTDMSWKELLSLVNFVKDMKKSDISMAGIKDLTSTTNEWFLYTPPRDLFGGASVLLPCRINSSDKWSDITFYHNLITFAPELVNDNIVSVYNTTKVGGIASVLEIILNRYSINLSEVGNASPREQSVIEYHTVKNENGEKDEEATARNAELAYFLGDWLGIPVEKNDENKDKKRGKSESITLAEVNTLNSDDEITEEEAIQDAGIANMEEENIYDINPSLINIYLGEDYIEKYRDDILWYRKCL